MRHWSTNEVHVLSENYRKENRAKLLELLPGRTWETIKSQACFRGLTIKSEKERWSPEEISVLREKYQVSPQEDLLKLFPGRTWREIAHKGSRIGLPRKYLRPGKVGSFSETEKAYIAGIVDGEGSITINITRCRWSPLISVINTYEELIDWLVPRFHVNKLKVKTLKRWKERYIINVWKTWDVITILEQIMPYLIVKKRNAELVLEFCKLKLFNLSGEPTSRDYEILKEIRTLNSHQKVSSS